MSLTPQQARAVERSEGSLLVRAGAGTGKTTVLVERIVRAVAEGGVPVGQILAITFTEKSAAEMRGRVRKALLARGRRDLARAAQDAWISTIHSFCSRVLRAHALSAGIDPQYRVLEQVEADRVGADAFDRALERFLGEGEDAQHLELVASYTPDRLRDMVGSVHSNLRSRGHLVPSLAPLPLPLPAGEHARLARAAQVALAELAQVGEGKKVLGAIAALERCGEALGQLADGTLSPPEAPGNWKLGGGANALKTPACLEYKEALEEYEALCVAHREHHHHTLLRELLELFGEQYAQLKRERSGLDFEDLQLFARDLLRDNKPLCEQYSHRFAQILVDEFQDVNPLQNELLGLLARDNLFRVGDQNQSIYGFRNADVKVFERQYEAARSGGQAESITVNFRSRGEVLDAIDLTFSRLWGERFEPLQEAPGVREQPPRLDPSIELLVSDNHKGRWEAHFGEGESPFGSWPPETAIWRVCEARLLAKRIDELTREGPYDFGDVVFLLRATTHMSIYERALMERGIPTHVVGGRGYWSQQQVADLRHWLAALANPMDGLALLSLLASPLVGASLDTVALIGLEAQSSGRDPWWVLRDPGELIDKLPQADRPRLREFVKLFEGQRAAAPRASLETLIDNAVTKTGYDRHILSLPAGERRMANVRKLMRMAREYEADEGRDLRGFIDHVAERDLVQAREGEAPLEAEHVRAVRLMTVHRAKGLEFPVVCVADLGKSARDDDGGLRISEAGELGLRLASLGGHKVNTETLERLKGEQRAEAEQEEQRILYVAFTRARERLLLSGATDLVKRAEPSELCEPMRWVLRTLCPELPAEGASGEYADSYDGREVRVLWQRCTPDTVDELLSEADRQPTRPVAEAAPAPRQASLELATVPAPRALPVSRLSYSGLEAYGRCAYRFYLERALRLPESDPAPAPGTGSATGNGALPGLPARLRGTLVHELLEGLDLRTPRLPSEDEVAALAQRNGHSPRAEDIADLLAMVGAFAGAELRGRLARARRVRKELPFAFTLTPPQAHGRSLLVNGVVDVLAEEEGGALVIDYKSDRLGEADPVALCEEQYATQRLIYALAALKAGAARAEVVHLFLERVDEPVSVVFEAAQAPALEERLMELAAGVVTGRFEPTADPHRELCLGCPGLPALCSWPRARTLAPRVAA